MNALVSKWLPHVARVLLGLVYFVFGLNGFLHFIPQPPPSGAAATFVGGLFSASYFLFLLKGTEVVAGALLLGNRLTAFALVLLAPITINIAAFHFWLAPAGSPLAVLLLLLQGYLAWVHRESYAPLFRTAARPEVERAARVKPALAG